MKTLLQSDDGDKVITPQHLVSYTRQTHMNIPPLWSILKLLFTAKSRMLLILAGMVLWAVSPASCWADGTKPNASGELFNYEGTAGLGGLTFDSGVTTSIVDADGSKKIKVDFLDVEAYSKDYPGVNFPIPPGGWDLSGFTGVRIEVTNPGADSITVNVRVDNEGDWHVSPWSVDMTTVAPGEKKTLLVPFGYTYNQPGFKLDPAHVIAIRFFIASQKHPVSILIGKPMVYKE